MNPARARILVADDDPAARDLLRRRLEAEGYDVALAEDGRLALAAIAERRPDLLIVDMMMPRLDGIGVIKRLREDPATAGLPILMLTARDRTVDKSFGLEAGADDYLGKPFEFPELLARIKSLLRRATGEWQASAATAARGRVVAVVGAKGGVGATTVAVNVGYALARAGTRTILADLRPFRGTVAALLGVNPRRWIDRLPLGRPELMTAAMVEDTLLEHASGLRLLLGPSGELDLPPAAGVAAAVEALRQLAAVVVADTTGPFDPFGTAALAAADEVWVVTEPEPTAADRAAAFVALLEQRGVRPGRIGIVANQTTPEMRLGIAEIGERIGKPVPFALPAAPQACVEAARRGVPLLELAPQLPTSRALAALAAQIASGRGIGTGALRAAAGEAVPAAAAPPAEQPAGSSARAAVRAAASRQQDAPSG